MKMKTSPSSQPHVKKTSVGAIVEWTILLTLFVVGVFFFLKGFGFISTNDIQPYPY